MVTYVARRRRHLHLDAAASDRHELVNEVADAVGRQPERPDRRHDVLGLPRCGRPWTLQDVIEARDAAFSR